MASAKTVAWLPAAALLSRLFIIMSFM